MSNEATFNGRVYVGKSIFRHDTEPKYSKTKFKDVADFATKVPGAVRHVIVDYSEAPVTFEALITGPSIIATGSSGLIVQTQKMVRDDMKADEVTAWRASFTSDMLTEAERGKIGKGDPFIVINAANVAKPPLSDTVKANRMRGSALWTALKAAYGDADDATLAGLYDDLAKTVKTS